MRILQIDRKSNAVKVLPEIADDLWHLERVLEKGDLVTGSTDRKIKPKEAGEKAERVKMFLTVEAEKIDFHRETGNLRVTGIIREGKPAGLVDLGSSHSIEIELGKPVRIKKKELKGFQVERLEKAARATRQGKMLLVVLDDEQADFAVLKEFELERRGTIRSGKSGKRFEAESVKGEYFKKIIDRVKEIAPEKVVFAGPGFTKEELEAWLKEKGVGGSFFFASINSVGITGLNELVKGNTLEKIALEMQLVKELRLVEKVFEELGKNSGMVEYGIAEVERAVEIGAVSELIVVDSFFAENREKIGEMMSKAEQMKGKIHLVDASNDAGKRLLSLGGVAALLRYPIQ